MSQLRCLLFILVFSVLLSATAGRAAGPNILLVLSDDHSAEQLGCYGNKDVRTPNLDRFAAQGLRCERVYVASPQCVPSRAAMMTGRSPVGLQNTRFSAPLAAEYITYPELLRGHGYFTGICGRNHHLDGADRAGPEVQKVYAAHELKTFSRRVDYLRVSNQRSALAEMKEFLELRPADKPFFLQVGFNDPHRPLDRGAIPQPHDPARLTLPAHYPDTPAVRDDLARLYDEIARMDGLFAEVLAELERRELARDTLVVFMGDNGASQLRGKGTLYELGIRVPLIARWPAVVKPGRTASELISGEDLAPTFLSAAGAGVPRTMTGRSFLPLLKGERFEGREYVFSERGAHGSELPRHSAAFDLGRCVVTRKYKLIYNALWQLPYTPVDFGGEAFWKELQAMNDAGKLSPELSRIYFQPQRPMLELYDLEKDPREFNNLAGTAPAGEVERELRAALAAWMILERDYLPIPIEPAPRARPAPAQ